MIRNAIVLSFSLLMLPSLSMAQCANGTSVECSDAKAGEATQSEPGNTSPNSATAGESASPDEAVTTNSREGFSSRKNKRRTERQFPRFETADPRDTVLSSETCVYSSATYTYTCR